MADRHRWIAAVVVALEACAPGAWNLEALEARHPELRTHGVHRLADATPYVLPVKGWLWFFTCRWPGEAQIPVSLPPDARDDERALIERALAALEQAVGVRFREDAQAGGGIHIRFAEAERGAGLPPTATALAECAVDASVRDAEPPNAGDVIAAHLVRASVELTRKRPTPIGSEEAHAEDELLGSMLHELGHALGFQGHARRGDTVMVRSVDEVRWVGRAVLAGNPLRDDTLRALYALPSGSVTSRARVGLARTDPVDHLAAVAARLALHGPWVRVGDRAGQVLWRDDAGNPYGFQIPAIQSVLREPDALLLVPSKRTTELLRGRP